MYRTLPQLRLTEFWNEVALPANGSHKERKGTTPAQIIPWYYLWHQQLPYNEIAKSPAVIYVLLRTSFIVR
jgi:hypothetical protein